MKSTIRIIGWIMLSVSMSSCDMIKGLADVEIDTSIEGNLDILTDAAELKSAEDHGFSEADTVDLINEDLGDYEDLIKDFHTKSITLRVLSVDSIGGDGERLPVTGVQLLPNTTFGLANDLTAYYWILNQAWDIEAGMSLSLDAASYDAIDDILKDELPVIFSAEGTCNKGNILFVLNYNLEATVIANPIK
jgi:hypothetical protein